MAKLPLSTSWISSHWSEPLWRFAFTPSNSPLLFSCCLCKHINCPDRFHSCREIRTHFLKRQRKGENLGFYDTESLGFGGSVIFQVQQDHTMSMCLRKHRAQVGKEEERIRKGIGEERERGEDRKTRLMGIFMHLSSLRIIVCVRKCPVFSFSTDKYPEEEFRDHRVIHRAHEFPFLHVLTNALSFLVFLMTATIFVSTVFLFLAAWNAAVPWTEEGMGARA